MLCQSSSWLLGVVRRMLSYLGKCPEFQYQAASQSENHRGQVNFSNVQEFHISQMDPVRLTVGWMSRDPSVRASIPCHFDESKFLFGLNKMIIQYFSVIQEGPPDMFHIRISTQISKSDFARIKKSFEIIATKFAHVTTAQLSELNYSTS